MLPGTAEFKLATQGLGNLPGLGVQKGTALCSDLTFAHFTTLHFANTREYKATGIISTGQSTGRATSQFAHSSLDV